MSEPHALAEIVTPNAVRVGGVLFYRPRTSESKEVKQLLCSRHIRGLKRELLYVHVMECQECGRTYEYVTTDYERCPHCGAEYKEVDPDAEG